MTATSRGCATCGRPITVTSRNPNRRYCTGRCRVAAWHERNRARRANAVAYAVPTAPDDVQAVTDNVAVPNDVVNGVARPDNAAPGAGSLTRCPSCRAPLTVLTWLLPPAAAQVTTPSPIQHG